MFGRPRSWWVRGVGKFIRLFRTGFPPTRLVRRPSGSAATPGRGGCAAGWASERSPEGAAGAVGDLPRDREQTTTPKVRRPGRASPRVPAPLLGGFSPAAGDLAPTRAVRPRRAERSAATDPGAQPPRGSALAGADPSAQPPRGSALAGADPSRSRPRGSALAGADSGPSRPRGSALAGADSGPQPPPWLGPCRRGLRPAAAPAAQPLPARTQARSRLRSRPRGSAPAGADPSPRAPRAPVAQLITLRTDRSVC